MCPSEQGWTHRTGRGMGILFNVDIEVSVKRRDRQKACALVCKGDRERGHLTEKLNKNKNLTLIYSFYFMQCYCIELDHFV